MSAGTASAGEPAIRARGLCRRFGARSALEALDLEVHAGESFGLLGANGAGKTTFLRLVTGCLLPSAGELTVLGRAPAREPTAVQREIGFVMETSRLYPELRVRGFLRFCAAAHGLGGAAREAAVDRVVERFQLASVADRPIGNLSKGFQQRVSLAQAFVAEPRLVIVDEPTSGLDPVQQRDVQAVLRELRGGCTLLLCTHDLREAEALTTRAAILHAGRLVAEGATGELLGQGDALRLFRARDGAAA